MLRSADEVRYSSCGRIDRIGVFLHKHEARVVGCEFPGFYVYGCCVCTSLHVGMYCFDGWMDVQMYG